jgi:hypothetical protein
MEGKLVLVLVVKEMRGKLTSRLLIQFSLMERLLIVFLAVLLALLMKQQQEILGGLRSLLALYP